MVERYSIAAVQFDAKRTYDKADVKENLSHVLRMIDDIMLAFKGYDHPIKYIVFPELGITTFTASSTKEVMPVSDSVPGEITDAVGEKAAQYGIYVTPGSIFEVDPKWKGAFFNTATLIGPTGKVEIRYRKTHPWVPAEFTTSPHDLIPMGYNEPLFPVAKTPLGNIGLYICNDGMFPETARQLAFNGAELLIHPTALMDPWATQPTEWWTLRDQSDAVCNSAYVVSAKIGSTAAPPYTWGGGSYIIDYQGRILTKSPDWGEHVMFTGVDVDGLRAYRTQTFGNQPMAHLRTEIFDYLKKPVYTSHAESHLDENLSEDKQLEVTKQIMQKFYKSYYH